MDGVDDTTPEQAPAAAPAAAAHHELAAHPVAAHVATESPAPTARRRRRPLLLGAAACALGIGLMSGGYALGASFGPAATASGTSQSGTTTTLPGSGSGSTSTLPGRLYGGSGSSNSGAGSSSSGTLNVTPASATQTAGVVTISTDLYYGQGAAAGTGMILTSDGRILTNNHVIQGATTITVTVESTGAQYAATVVGDNPTADIAVLQLQNASGLTPITMNTNATVSTGASVASIGNANGTGTLVVASGSVVATNQSITVQNDLTGTPEQLANLIEVSADVVSGDSGGPLVDANGAVIGVVTAASSGTANVTGYAIPISSALSIADQIVAGSTSNGITQGTPAFLGVSLSSRTTARGALIGSVIAGLPAEKAGLAAGDTITSVNGSAVTSSSGLTTLIDSHKPGDTVTIGYTDAAGASHSVAVTLVAGPAD